MLAQIRSESDELTGFESISPQLSTATVSFTPTRHPKSFFASEPVANSPFHIPVSERSSICPAFPPLLGVWSGPELRVTGGLQALEQHRGQSQAAHDMNIVSSSSTLCRNSEEKAYAPFTENGEKHTVWALLSPSILSHIAKANVLNSHHPITIVW